MIGMKKIKVFLVDSHVFYREGVRMVLSREGDIQVIGEAGDGEEALSYIKSSLPEVVVLDSELPSLDGLHLTRQIRRYSPTIAVIFLAANDDDEMLMLAIKAGAASYLTKAATNKQLIEHIRRVAQGEYPINDNLLSRPGVASRVLQQFQHLSLHEKEVESLISPLTRRETEILEYIAEGNSNKEVAHALGICNQTVKNHVTSIIRKLAANDRTHAVVLASRHGFITV